MEVPLSQAEGSNFGKRKEVCLCTRFVSQLLGAAVEPVSTAGEDENSCSDSADNDLAVL